MNVLPEINYYTFSLFLGGVIALVSGVSVYLKGEKGQQNIAWLLLNISTAVWSFGYLFMIVSVNEKIALLSNWTLHFGAIFIPFFYFLFIAHITGTYQKYKKYLYVGGVFLILFFLLNTTTLFIKGVLPKYPFNYAPDAGPLYVYFTLYFFVFVILAIIVLVSRIPRTQGEEAARLKYILWSSIAGFLGGGSVFFLTFNINIPPYPLIMFSLYPMIIAYAILKHHLFDIKLVLVELAILLLNMFLLFNVFTSHATTDLILNISVSAFVFLFSVVLMRGIYKDIRDRERIEGLVKEMEIANERLRMLEGQKTEFVSIASHQLRTPLTVIKGYASMVLEGTFGAISDSVRDAMDKLYKSSERIVSLVEDLLTVSRIEQGRMMLVFETINLKDLVQGVLEETQAGAAEAKIDFSFTAEEGKEFFVAVDEKKFKQVVRHILDNAIKYTPAPGSVHVTVADDSLTKKVRLTISDTGIGMTPEQITAIFERFNLKVGEGQLTTDKEHLEQEDQIQTHRGPTLNTGEEIQRGPTLNTDSKGRTSGTGAGESRSEESKMMGDNRTPGIGLYIAQEIIEAHHGTIRIESAGPDRGTTVVVELPRATKA